MFKFPFVTSQLLPQMKTYVKFLYYNVNDAKLEE